MIDTGSKIKDKAGDWVKTKVWDNMRESVWNRGRDRYNVWVRVRASVKTNVKINVWANARKRINAMFWSMVLKTVEARVLGKIKGNLWDRFNSELEEWDKQF